MVEKTKTLHQKMVKSIQSTQSFLSFDDKGLVPTPKLRSDFENCLRAAPWRSRNTATANQQLQSSSAFYDDLILKIKQTKITGINKKHDQSLLERHEQQKKEMLQTFYDDFTNTTLKPNSHIKSSKLPVLNDVLAPFDHYVAAPDFETVLKQHNRRSVATYFLQDNEVADEPAELRQSKTVKRVIDLIDGQYVTGVDSLVTHYYTDSDEEAREMSKKHSVNVSVSLNNISHHYFSLNLFSFLPEICE